MNLLSILDGTPEPPIIDLHLENVNESGEYDLPTPMYEFQKELTDQIVSLHYPDILKYCETNDTKELIIKSLEICIENCMMVSTHPYLLINHYMPKNLALKDMSSKLADTSGKFNVLRDLMNVITQNASSKSTKNVGIVMKNLPRFFDLTEALLLGCKGNKSIKRYVGNHVRKESTKANKHSHHANGHDIQPTNIHLIPQDGKLAKYEDVLLQTKFDILIVFDGTVDTQSDFFNQLRTQNRRGEAIIIRLIPMRTIEHCQLFYSKQKHEKNYLYKLISSIVCLRDQIGNLPPDIIPIYNQNLQYLSQNFFDQLFKTGSRSGPRFPAWPLPELPTIPKFNSTDVERSLLTEVHFHYTPYDSTDNVIDYVSTSKKPTKKSYYELKRLELDYVTNPLKNDFNTLIGIYSNDNSTKSTQRTEINKSILTHRLIMQLNNAYKNLDIVNLEHQAHLQFNDNERQEKFGRREKEYNMTLSKICDDIDHTQHRIDFAEKQFLRKTEKIEEIKQKNAEVQTALESFIKEKNIDDDEKRKKFVENQFKIWELRKQISDTLLKVKSKNEENAYMTTEYQNAAKSIEDSNKEIKQTVDDIKDLKRKIETAFETNEDNKKFKKQRQNLLDKIELAKEKDDVLKKKLGKSLKFLRDTSHLKKRKGRGATPNSK